MGDRITIAFESTGALHYMSARIYFHWAGISALDTACRVIRSGIANHPATAMVNLVYLWCEEHGGMQGSSVYLDDECPAGTDEGDWTYNFTTKVWTCVSYGSRAGRSSYTLENIESGRWREEDD